MADIEFKLNYRGVTELLKSREIAAQLEEHAERVKTEAERIAPVETGHYVESIESGSFDDGDRTTAYVAATVPYALKVETKHRVLGRALNEAGL